MEPNHKTPTPGVIPGWGSGGQDYGDKHAPVFARSMQMAQMQAHKDANAYQTVLEQVKAALQAGRKISPAAFDNPTEDDMKLVEDEAAAAIKIYNAKAPAQGAPLLITEAQGTEGFNEQVRGIAHQMMNDVLGWGPIAPYMADPEVEDIMINGYDAIFVQKAGGFPVKVNASFRSAQALRVWINGKLDHGGGGRGVTTRTPYRDHRLADGSRVHVVMDPLVSNLGMGAIVITIRRFRSVARNVDDLVKLGSITPQLALLLKAAVAAQLNMCISGGTGTGKTTFMSAMSAHIDPGQRVVTVEDTPELQLRHMPNWVALVTRETGENAEAVTMADDVRHSLRMRPRRILLGEARGAEMIAILEAMNTGHDWCMFTVHADDAVKTLQRMETLYLKGGMGNVPILAVRREIAQAVQLVINIAVFMHPDGKEIRRVKEVAYVMGGVEGDRIASEPLFEWQVERGQPLYTGRLVYTGAHPSGLINRLEQRDRSFSWEAMTRL